MYVADGGPAPTSIGGAGKEPPNGRWGPCAIAAETTGGGAAGAAVAAPASLPTAAAAYAAAAAAVAGGCDSGGVTGAPSAWDPSSTCTHACCVAVSRSPRRLSRRRRGPRDWCGRDSGQGVEPRAQCGSSCITAGNAKAAVVARAG